MPDSSASEFHILGESVGTPERVLVGRQQIHLHLPEDRVEALSRDGVNETVFLNGMHEQGVDVEWTDDA